MKRALALGAITILGGVVAVTMVQADSSMHAAGEVLGPPVIHEPHLTSLPCPAKPVSTPDLEGCIERRLLATDRRIDKLGEAAFADLDDAHLQRLFIASHRAWLSYRKTDCADLWAVEDGTIYSVLVGECELARNRQRIKDLRAVLAWPEKP